MQRAWANRLNLALKIVLPILLVCICVILDQITKFYFKNELSYGEKRFVIDDFFYFTHTVNTGAAWSFLADKSWSQIFFKILTSVALSAFVIFFVFAIKKKHKWLTYCLAFIIGGTVGNFIDRIVFNGVMDFIGLLFGDYAFPIFNLADSFLVVGLIMLIFYFLFLDNNALFKFKKKNAQEANFDVIYKVKEGQGSDEEDISC